MLFHPKSYLKPFLWFAPDSGGGSDSGDDVTDDADTETDGGTGSGDDPKKEDKKFTQKDLDTLVGDARKSGRASATATLLKELGLDTVDALKTFVTDAKKLQEAQMTEAEKQKAALEAAQKAATEAQAEKDKALALANERLMRAAVMAEASKAEHKLNPAAINDVWLFIDRSKLEMTDDGEVKKVAEAVKAVLKDRPYLQQNGKTPGTPLRESVAQRAARQQAGLAERQRTITKL